MTGYFIELAHRRAESGHSTGIQTYNDYYRSINYAVRNWVTEVTRT